MSRPRFELRGVHILAAMLLFFGAVTAINVAFAVAAVRSFPGEDVRRSYLQGLNYNGTLAERRLQAASGWQAHGSLIETGDGAEVRVVMLDAEDRPLDGMTVEGELRWPTDARLDRALVFEAQGAGVHVAQLGVLRPGRWTMRARGTAANGRALDFEAEFTWPSTR